MSRKVFLTYFDEEMHYLRTQGSLFAKKHPQIAALLNIGQYESKDPHVERLLESFAFLTAKLNQKVDDNFTKIGESLLHVLHPHYTKLTPSFSVAHFSPNTKQTIFVKRHTEIWTQNKVRFRTLVDTYIHPFKIQNVSTEDNFIKLSLTCPNLVDFSTLTVHIQGDQKRASSIFQVILGGDIYYSFNDNSQEKFLLQNSDFNFVGFRKNETVAPSSSHNYTYNLLQDYARYPDKFFFFTINLKNMPKPPQNIFTLWIPINSAQHSVKLKVTDFNIHCIPVVNLFEISTDPITVQNNKVEYPLTVNSSTPDDYEIYSILKLFNNAGEIKPFFNRDHDGDIYYAAHVKPALIENLTGTDTYIKFHFENFETLKERMIIYGKVLATNRNKINEVTENDVFQSDVSIPRIQLVYRPHYFPYQPPHQIWKLISQLSMGHLYFSDVNHSLSILKETLRLNGVNEPVIAALKKITCKNATHRFLQNGFHGYLRGVEITLEAKIDGMVVLLAMVLHQFFVAQVTMNHFISLTLVDTDTKKEVRTWEPLIGKQRIL